MSGDIPPDRFGICIDAAERPDRAKVYFLHVDGHAGQHGRLDGGLALRGPTCRELVRNLGDLPVGVGHAVNPPAAAQPACH
jgi:hypothetical protein